LNAVDAAANRVIGSIYYLLFSNFYFATET
jgi:hypothetical protein